MISDFNCKIFDIDKLSTISSFIDTECLEREKIKSDLKIMDSCSIHRLVCQISHNENSSVRQTKNKICLFKKYINQSIPKEFKNKFDIYAYPKIQLSLSSSYINRFSSLCFGADNYIFLELPIFPSSFEMIDSSINKILYNCKALPIFTDFQIYNDIYSPDLIRRLINIKGAAFQIMLSRTLRDEDIDIIRKVYLTENIVLFGISADHNHLNKSIIIQNICSLQKKLGDNTYMDILIKAHNFLR